MNTIAESDVLIAGAGTTGSYLAWKLSEAGFDCVVLEKETLDSLGSHIGPFHMEEVAFERFDIPPPSGDEFLHRVCDVHMWPPGPGPGVDFELPTLVMDKPLFNQRLHRYAQEAGAEIVEGARVIAPLVDGGMLRGLKVDRGGEEVEAGARLVIDATGMEGAVRSLLPPHRFLETDVVSEADTLHVYMETWEDLEGRVPSGVNPSPYYQGWSAPGPGDTRIVGIGMAGGVEAAKARHAVFKETLPYTGRVVASTFGTVPYRRPPYSLVDNSFMVVGDAAYMNKPFSGEGVTSAFAACLILIDVAIRALESDDLTRESLWDYNVGYFRGQGSRFAFLTALIPGLMTLSSGEMDFLFSVPGLLTEEASLQLQLEYEVRPDPKQSLAALPSLLKGILGSRLKPASLMRLAGYAVVAGLLKSVYARFPEDPGLFGLWTRAAEPLWNRAAAGRRSYFEGVLAGLDLA